ncbi:fatty acid-binding protein, intestinal [Zalophus californianus]|uniref:Fatty acid-binding protein, intestinal n=1 Tax=Zalophus californianus TaxID=9704 RepID=A0A6J2DET1_ZALCA|nr:fatty acid-binding protein, intestinal [Zalophus californianus]XP_027943187.1 fatty acid-binding protein, intestinal [Eumetopias jubatus]
MALDGTWKIDRNENYDKFMEKMGVNMVKRKLAAHDNLKLTITQEGNKFTVKESSSFRTIEIVFELGVTFNYSLADGTELSGTWNLEGNKLVGKFRRVDNGNELNAIREIIAGELVQTYTYEGVKAQRIFKKE